MYDLFSMIIISLISFHIFMVTSIVMDSVFDRIWLLNLKWAFSKKWKEAQKYNNDMTHFKGHME